ncbi:undecaprenyl-diphosphate phosphatase [Glaciihabitans arcticus]|uniref:Undecaprenyl-diphosphatase n=1 Tax=Glaciihabitans arcticus TaxID=2668039 RepID=A0A4Q9GSL9_9MICO|nr:undecaprenyl-diphosphate phosphatase [Glaciihabitans arcticus]TBN56608.1 undecaprenyl-diphosphate phosphatase [Glaciihabitans arcticus]
MSFIEAIILGLVQGLTEFLPISSSAHLLIIGQVMGKDPGATFTAISQLGTELAVIIYFRKDIARIIGKWFASFRSRGGAHSDGISKDDPDVRLGWLIIIGTIPIVIVGYLAQDAIDTTLRSLWITAVVLIVFGIILGLADLLGKKVRPLESMTYRDGVLIGIAQMLALIPGVSRSGATLTMGRALGYDRPAAARYGFLLAIPAVFGSGLYKLAKSFSEPGGAYGYPETIVATVVAFFVGFAVIAFLLRYISKHSFLPFVIYRVVLGGALLVLLSTGVLDPL